MPAAMVILAAREPRGAPYAWLWASAFWAVDRLYLLEYLGTLTKSVHYYPLTVPMFSSSGWLRLQAPVMLLGCRVTHHLVSSPAIRCGSDHCTFQERSVPLVRGIVCTLTTISAAASSSAGSCSASAPVSAPSTAAAAGWAQQTCVSSARFFF